MAASKSYKEAQIQALSVLQIKLFFSLSQKRMGILTYGRLYRISCRLLYYISLALRLTEFPEIATQYTLPVMPLYSGISYIK